MAYVTVPKDLTKVKTKVALNLTKRQLVCFSMAAAVGVPLFFLIKGSVPQTAATFLMVLAMLPFFLFAMYEKHGQPLEKVLGNIIRVFFLTPKERPYQTENYYAVLAKQRKLNKEVTAIAKKSYQRQTAKSAGKRENPAHTGRKKQIAALMRQAKGDGKKHTAQQTIPYLQMYPDGICRVKDNLFSKSVEFSDINYQLAQPDDKTATFEALCDFYNSLDSSVGLQLTFVNRVAGQGDFSKSIAIPPQQDGFDDVREEYAAMLQNQLAKGNNGLVKHKYLTFTLEADSLKNAKSRLNCRTAN